MCLGHHVRAEMARPRCQPAGAEPSQGAPAQLMSNAAPEALSQPLSHSPPAPVVAVGLELGQSCSQ
jgi:hypothetical protein